ncbi:MAG TPA: trypsin-like peptidase domain-containing protein [Thermomicrobiales bacterium]|nr:trypsin-like peptidase domain-containing protein [Thermomicrobiales bacterium]
MSGAHKGNAGEFSAALADAVAQAANWTVRVDGRRRYAASGIIWADGVVVAANHTVERDDDVTVTGPDGTEHEATSAGRDPGSDIVVLKVEGLTASAPRADAVRVGMLVMAVGRARRGEAEASLGIVSATGSGGRRSRRRRGGRMPEMIRPDVTMYPGFSGGPLVTVDGALIGMNTSAFRGGSMTLPNATLEPIVEQLLAHGRLKRGYLGLTSQPVALPGEVATDEQSSGLLVIAVEEDSPASSTGLMVGDILIGIDGDPLRDTDDLRDALGGDRAGSTATLRIVRGGALHEVSATIGER